MIPVGLERFGEIAHMAGVLHWMDTGYIKRACQLSARVMLFLKGELEGKSRNSTRQAMSSPAVCCPTAHQAHEQSRMGPIDSSVIIRNSYKPNSKSN